MSNGYNGWTNYETWRTNLELVEGLAPHEFLADQMADIAGNRDEAVEGLAEWMEEMAYEVVNEQASGWALDLATSFLASVDWEEIAEHYVDDYIAEMA
jgi:hypothetical protein